MTDAERADRALRPLLEAAGELATATSKVAAGVSGAGGADGAIPAARTVVARLRGQARDLLTRLDDAEARLSALEAAARTARGHDPKRWPERREAIAAKLAAGPLDGAAAWLAAWARAFLLGCPAEAKRLVTEPFRLPPEAAWCPDRLATAADALTARSVRRLEPLLRYLADGAPLAGRAAVGGDLRAHALVLHARLLLHAGLPGAADLLGRASAAGRPDEPEVPAVRAAMVRLSAAPGNPRAQEQAALARQAWKAGPCAAAAVEMFHAGRRSMDDARVLVDELPAVADPEGALDVLVLPVPDEIWLAAAARAARERDFEAARRLAGRLGSGAGAPLGAEAAGLRVHIAREAGEAAAAVAGLLSAAGLASAAAGSARRAIEQYTEALRLVPGHQEAALGLADALLVESWGKPLGEVAGRFHRAVEILDAGHARHPLEAGTSWSLVTYSYLASALSNQAAAQARAREVWRAPIAAARAIAFDPSQAQRWVRLAETLIELNCDQAAAVLSGHATRLAPDDPVVARNRVATLTSLGDTAAAFALLDQASAEGGDGWFSAVRAIATKVSAHGMPGQAAAERLGQALSAANEAIRIEPQNLWFHLVRADVLLRAGRDELAGEDFEYLWRASRLDQADGLSFATRAAVELQLGGDAVALSTQALDLATATVGDYGDRFNRGAALALVGDPDGLPYLEAAIGLASTPFAIDYLRGRLGRLTGVLRREGTTLDLTAAGRALDARAAEVAADTRAPLARIDAELGRAARNGNYPREVSRLASLAASLTRAWCAAALGDRRGQALLAALAGEHPEYPELASAARALAGAPLPGLEPGYVPGTAHVRPGTPVPGEQAVQAFLPASWFAGLADPADHDLVKRFVPDARARLRRRSGAILPGVNFRDAASLEPAGFRILVHGTEVAAGQLEATRWYCPADLAAGLPALLRAGARAAPEAAGPASFGLLLSFPAPAGPDPVTALVAWPPAEVVARRLELAFEAWQAAEESGAGTPAPPGQA